MREYPYKMISKTATVSEYFPAALTNRKPGITASTRRGYMSKYRQHIEPYIGTFEIPKVTNTMCQMILNRMRGYSRDTIKKVRELLYFIFDCAETQNIIQLNPARNLKLPENKNPERRRALTDEEYILTVNAIDSNPKYLVFAIMLFAGCRPAEAADITYDDIDIQKRLLHVPGTKTKNANRYVPLTDELLQRIPEEGTGYIAKDAYNHHMSANTRQRLWIKLQKDAELPEDVTAYCLRHTYATYLFRAGVDVRTAQKLLGHASITTTVDTYTHVNNNDINQAGDLLNSFHFPKRDGK